MRILSTLMVILLAPLGYAGLPQPGEPLTPLSIEDKGELILEGEETAFRAWRLGDAEGYPQVVQYLAARLSASKINEPFTDTLGAAGLSHDHYRVTTIINLDDALWGTGGFVIRELEKNKRAHPHAIMVADAQGTGLAEWELERENSAIILLDASGIVRFFKQGALSDTEIAEVVQMLRNLVAERLGGSN